jgi:hypothetical protein
MFKLTAAVLSSNDKPSLVWPTMIMGTVRSIRVLRRASIPENLAATLTCDPPPILMLKRITVCGARKRKVQVDAKSKTHAFVCASIVQDTRSRGSPRGSGLS